MSANDKNLFDINRFKQDKKKNKLLEEAREFIDNNEIRKALKISRKAYNLFPKSKEIIFTYAQSLFLCGYKNKATKLLEQIEDYKEPYYTGSWVWFLLSVCYCYQNKKLSKALEYINRAIKSDEENFSNVVLGRFYLAKARILYALGNYDMALSFLQKTNDIVETLVSKIYMSKVCIKLGEYLKARLYFNKVLKELYLEGIEIFEKEKKDIFTYDEIDVILDVLLNKLKYIKINSKIKKSIIENKEFCSLKSADFIVYSDKFAIGLKYDKKINPVPFVVYKSNKVSKTLILSFIFKIVILKDKITGRLYRNTSLYAMIDKKFFAPVAEIYAYVDYIKKKK